MFTLILIESVTVILDLVKESIELLLSSRVKPCHLHIPGGDFSILDLIALFYVKKEVC